MAKRHVSFRLEIDVLDKLRLLSDVSPTHYGITMSQAQVLDMLIRREPEPDVEAPHQAKPRKPRE